MGIITYHTCLVWHIQVTQSAAVLMGTREKGERKPDIDLLCLKILW
jgi:hypothetical protein